jgi:mono/diheme cytochrome c family protein
MSWLDALADELSAGWMRRAAGLIGLLGAVVAVGCGTTEPAQPSGGQVLFAQDCRVCHSLSGRQSPQRQGGDLLRFHAGRGAMLQFVQEMPVGHRLSRAQLREVAGYVLAVERSARSG